VPSTSCPEISITIAPTLCFSHYDVHGEPMFLECDTLTASRSVGPDGFVYAQSFVLNGNETQQQIDLLSDLACRAVHASTDAL